MKRNIIHILACLLALSSCHKQDQQDHPARAIDFGTMGTKAGVTAETIGAAGSAFIVRGAFTQSGTSYTLFDGTTVTSDGTEWTYSPVQYWAVSSSYKFRAVWPADAFTGTGAASYTDDLGTNGAQIAGFTVSSSPDAQKDLLISNLATATTDGTGAPTPEKVNLNFQHILSDVQIQVKVEDAGEEIILKSIELSGMQGSGSYAYAATAYAWTPSGTAQTYSKDLTSLPALTASFPTDPQCELLMIPQTLTGGMAIKLVYSIGGTDTTVNLKTADGTSWEIGKKYIYQITIATAKIEFTAKVVDWVDGSTITLTK